MGELIVRVLKGLNLVIGDHIVRSSDPYVVIRLGEQTRKTRVKKKTLNPIWDEGFTFTDVSYRDYSLLTVEVFDEDRFPKFKQKDFLGKAEIDLQPLLEESYPMATGKKVVPQSNNICLAKDSCIVQYDQGRIVQDVCLKLGKVKSGLLEMKLEWQP
jgi:Ca2+-dependent lipid-binding protein